MTKLPRCFLAVCGLLFAPVCLAQNAQLAIPLPDEIPSITAHRTSRAAAMAKQGAPAAFAVQHPGWQLTVNARTGSPHRAWGDGIVIPGYAVITSANAAEAGMRFVNEHAALLNCNPEQLTLQSAFIAGGRAYVKFAQEYRGLRVLHSLLDLRIALDGRVFLFGSDYHPGIAISTLPALGLEAARHFALAGIMDPPDAIEIEDGALAVLPMEYSDRVEYRLVYNFVVRNSPDEAWDTYVDAQNGSILWRRNLVSTFAGGDETPTPATRTVVGKVQASIYVDSWLRGATLLPVPNAYVNVGGKELVTDADGVFTTDISGDSATVVARLSGLYALARRADSSVSLKNARYTGVIHAGDTLFIRWDSTNSTAAERMVLYHVTGTRAFIRSIDTSAMMVDLDKQMGAVVNINAECNANWNGKTVNFFHATDKCGNTAEIADVIEHEYGHAVNQFLYHRVSGANLRNGALSEGTADINANMLRDDPLIGIGFFKNAGLGTIRNSDNTLQYPKDQQGEIHLDGQILTGAVWDMRKSIGLDASRRLTHFCKYGTPDGATNGAAFADYLLEILVADDDDGNLANGTPHGNAIIAAFVKHNIGGAWILLAHSGVADIEDAGTPVPISGSVSIKEALVKNLFSIASVQLVRSIDNWHTQDTTQLAFDAVAGAFSGMFPSLPGPAIVHYYLVGRDNFGDVATLPEAAPLTDFVYVAGYKRTFFNNAEAADGWTVTGDAKRGLWIRDVPIGTYNTNAGAPPDVPWVQPNEDHTPGAGNTKCWVTGNAAASLGMNYNDVDSGKTILTSGLYALSGLHDPLLRYYRWFTNSAGSNPGSDPWFVRVSSNGGATWVNLEYTTKSDASWSPRIYRLRDFITLSDSVALMFIAADNPPESTVEAAVDDVEILDGDGIAATGHGVVQPEGLTLDAGYPNPASGSSSLRFTLPSRGSVLLRIVAVTGETVLTAASGLFDGGTHTLRLSLETLAPGMYVCRLDWNGSSVSRPLLLLR